MVGGRRDLTTKLTALVVAAAALGCGPNKVCGGVASCYAPPGAQCPPSCTATPVCMENPNRGLDCAAATTENDCLVNVTATFCYWSNGACSGPCSQATDMTSCQSVPVGCVWSICSGTPKTCDTYSLNSCPAAAGCSVMTEDEGRLFE